jgi:hypothetical protein
MKQATNIAIIAALLAFAFFASGAVSGFAGVALFFFLLGKAMDFYALPDEKKKNDHIPAAGNMVTFNPIRPLKKEVPPHLCAPRSIMHLYRPNRVPRRAVTDKRLTNPARKHSVLNGLRRMTITGNGRTTAQAQSGDYYQPQTFDEVRTTTARKVVPDHQLEVTI